MTLFNDLYQKGSFKILSEAKTDDGIMQVLVPFTQTGVKNSNGRIYPRAIMQREVNRISQDISDGKMLGSADHPKSGNTELDKVSHIVSSMELDDNGKGWAKLKILDTNSGKNLKVILKSGGVLGISTRGFGSFNSETSEVKDDYQLTGLDIVSNPSYKAGTFSQDNIFESADLIEKKKVNTGSSGAYMKEGIVKNKLVEELREDTEFSRVTKRLYEDEKDFTGTLLEYAEKNGLQIKAVLGVENGQFESYEMAYIKLKGGEQLIADGKKQDGLPDRPVEVKDVLETARIAGVHPQKMVDAMNKYRDKPAATDRRIAIRKQLILSGEANRTPEELDALVEKLLAGEKIICEESKRKRLLLEDEKLKEKQRLKKNKRLTIKEEMIKAMSMGGFTESQISVAIERRMTQLDEQEQED